MPFLWFDGFWELNDDVSDFQNDEICIEPSFVEFNSAAVLLRQVRHVTQGQRFQWFTNAKFISRKMSLLNPMECQNDSLKLRSGNDKLRFYYNDNNNSISGKKSLSLGTKLSDLNTTHWTEVRNVKQNTNSLWLWECRRYALRSMFYASQLVHCACVNYN